MADVFIGSYEQGSREILDYAIDWASVLTAESDTASTSQWYAESGNPTLGNGTNGAAAPSLAANKAKVWVVGGTAGQTYALSNTLTTSAGRRFEASIKIKIIDK